MEWTDIQITVPQQYAETAEAIATMVSNGGIYIEDYRDLEQQAWEIAHVDLIEQDLLDQPRDIVKVHMYLAPDENPAEILPLFKERLEASGVEYKLETSGIEQEDWQNAWKKYYHAMDIGQRLAIVPGWETYDTDRIVITMDPGMAFGTGTHETTSLCLETLDSMVSWALPKPRAWILTPCACAPPARMPSETAWPSTLPCWWAIFLTKPAANTTSSPQTLWRRLSCPLRRMCRY